MKPYARSVLLLLLGAAMLSVNVWAQSPGTKTREIVLRSWKGEPVAVTSATAGTQTVKPGQSFVAGDNWLNGLTLQVKNVTTKPIQGLAVLVRFPDVIVVERGKPFGIELSFGSTPFNGATASTLAPATETPLLLTAQHFEQVRALAAKSAKLSNVTKIEVVLVGVYFADGTYWEGGEWFDEKGEPASKTSATSVQAGRGGFTPAAGWCGIFRKYNRYVCCFADPPACNITHFVRWAEIIDSPNGVATIDATATACACDLSVMCDVWYAVPCGDRFDPI